MYVDKELEFSNDQVVTASAASTNHVKKPKGDSGVSEQKYIAITVKEAATASGAATVTFSLQVDDNAAFSSPKTVYSTAAIGKAALVLGYQFFMPIPLGADEEFMRLQYDVGTGPLTAGKFHAAVVDQPQLDRIYPDAL